MRAQPDAPPLDGEHIVNKIPRIYADLMSEDTVTLERGRPVTDTELLRPAKCCAGRTGSGFGLTVAGVVARALELVKASGSR